MSNYKIAIDKVLKSEGGYVNDPTDRGGETYRGIARKFWSTWKGWLIIDKLKSVNGWQSSLKNNTELNNLVIEFYKMNFWDKIGGDRINNQRIGDILVDAAVLEGISSAIKRAQKIVGITQTGVVSNELIDKLNKLS